MGQLTATVQAHSETLKELPEQVAQRVLPRVILLEEGFSKLSTRMTAVEKQQWMYLGGFTVAVLFLKYGPTITTLIKAP